MCGDATAEPAGRRRPGHAPAGKAWTWSLAACNETWTGTVTRVGNWVARKRAVALEPGEVGDVRTVECVVGLDSPPPDLLVGQRVRVRIGRAD